MHHLGGIQTTTILRGGLELRAKLSIQSWSASHHLISSPLIPSQFVDAWALREQSLLMIICAWPCLLCEVCKANFASLQQHLKRGCSSLGPELPPWFIPDACLGPGVPKSGGNVWGRARPQAWQLAAREHANLDMSFRCTPAQSGAAS